MCMSDLSSVVCSSDRPSWAAPTVTVCWLTVISRRPEPIAASGRLVAGQRHPVHEPTEAVVVVDRIVLGATVVPEGDGARRPAEPAGELGLHLVAEQELQDRRALLLGHALEMRSEEHTTELQSLMRISYAVF